MCVHYQFMNEAVELSRKSMNTNKGGPFGAIIVKNNIVVGRGSNIVTSSNDPTAHAEVEAIRDACKNLGTFQLNGCVLYTSCEPCPMCLGAIYWARPEKVYFANTRQDAANIGFDDDFIYNEITIPLEKRQIIFEQIQQENALEVFQEWKLKTDKINY